MFKVQRALLSVYDKDGLAELARGLAALGVELVSSGGTAAALRAGGLAVRDVSELTGFPELMDGRVKTLHPKIHGGILGRRDDPAHARQAAQQGIGWIDLVVVNLYPFARTVARPGVGLDEALENVDIGGPALVRAAAKNFPHVAVVVDPADYGGLLEELRAGDLTPERRRDLAVKAFEHTAAYDAAVAGWLGGSAGFPPVLRRAAELRYGENPHQKGWLYEDLGVAANSLARAARHGAGKELSYNNYLDLDAALNLVLDLEGPAAAVVKHGNPCGAAEADAPAEAFARALAGDPVSAFGGVVALNRPIDRALAEEIGRKENFFEAIAAPGFGPGAVEALRDGPRWGRNLRLLEVALDRSAARPARLRSILGGVLVQTDDAALFERFESVTVPPTEAQRRDLVFAWTVCKHVKSNAVVLARDRAVVGVGAGQPSRVDSARLAVQKAGERARGAVAASDAFFPFPDAVEELLRGGVAAVAQPGGSVRDQEVFALARRNALPMVVTGTRHFRH